MSTLSPSKHTGMIRIRFIYLYCLVIVVDNDRSIFSLASPFSHKFVAFKLISYPISILLLYLNSGINSWIPSIAQFMDLAFSCLVWSCEASGKAQTKYWKSTRNLLFCWCNTHLYGYNQAREGWYRWKEKTDESAMVVVQQRSIPLFTSMWSCWAQQ